MPIKLEFRVVVYLKFAKRHTRELNWYCHLAVLRQITGPCFLCSKPRVGSCIAENGSY